MCGARVSTSARFCSSCGQAMDSDTGTTLVENAAGYEGESAVTGLARAKLKF